MNWMKIQMGTWKPADVELKELEGKFHEAHVAHVIAQATGEDADVASKEKTLADMRKKSKNSLDLAATVLGDRLTQIYGRIIMRFTSIQHEAMVVDLHSCRDQDGSARWSGIRSAMGGSEDCKMFAAVTLDMAFLQTLGLTTQACFYGQDPMAFEEEAAVATKAMTMALEMISAHAWSSTQFWMTMPHSFAIGLHPDHEIATAGLLARARDWNLILNFETWALSPEAMLPRQGHEGCQQPAEQSKYPQCAKLLDMLDFHKHQIVREVCLAMSMPMDGVPAWSPNHPEGKEVLRYMFGNITNTKTFLEDTFRDVREMLRRTGQTTSRYLRMYHALVSGVRRAKDHLLPIVELPASAFVDTKLRRTKMTDAVFTPPSNPQKGQAAMEQCRPFDVGVPIHLADGLVLEPLIDLTQLMGSAVPQASKRSNPAGLVVGSGGIVDPTQEPGGDKPPRDLADQVSYRAAGPVAKNRSAAAMGLIQGLGHVLPCEWEECILHAWRGCLLGKGLLYKIQRAPPLVPTVFVSLGFVDYAVLCWRVEPFTGHGHTWCSLVSPSDMPLFWVYGHELTDLDCCCGLANTLVVPALQPVTLPLRGLLWKVTEEVSLIRFAFHNKVPFTTKHLSFIAKTMNLRPAKLMGKTNPKDQACAIATVIARAVCQDMEEVDRLALVQAIVEPDIVSNIVNSDPVLDHILEELRSQEQTSYGKFVDLHDHVKGQKAMKKALEEHAADSRVGRVRGPTLQLTPFKYRADTLW